MADVALTMYAQRQHTLKVNWKMMENRARFIAKTANDLVDEGDSYSVQRILMEVLPKDVNYPTDKPYTNEAETALRESLCHNTAILRGHTEAVKFVSFSPDGKRIVSASWDKTIRIWDAETGRQIGQPLEGHLDVVNSASFSPDGKWIVSASSDGTIRIWSFPPLQDLIDQTRERFKDRLLTPEERHQYYLE